MNLESTLIVWKDPKNVPSPPFYASIFNYIRSEDLSGYQEMDQATLESAQQQPGFLGYESITNQNRSSFISYWQSLESIDNWRNNTLHQKAKAKGKKQWYKYYHSMIAKVESIHFHNL